MEGGGRRVCRPERVVVRGCGSGDGGSSFREADGGGGAVTGSGRTIFVDGRVEGGGAAEPVLPCFPKEPSEAVLSIACISKLFNNLHAASTRSGVSRLMTPMVRWIDPTGRMALVGSMPSPASLGVVTSAAKRWSEDCSCGRVVGVTRGRRRKWVSLGLGVGGMVGSRGPWGGRRCVW